MNKTTILVEKRTREQLRKKGTKGQTYDKIISDLLKSKDSPDLSFLKPASSESIIGGQ